MPKVPIRGASLFVELAGAGYPLLLMHGGPGGDHTSMLGFRRCADQFTLILYDHRCNGRSTGARVQTMTWDNLTADADALRHRLGYERWAVLGHSFGGHVALEYALRYPDRVSHLVLLDTGADGHWARENAPAVVTERGYGDAMAKLVRRWFTGDFERWEMLPIFYRIGDAYSYDPSLRSLLNIAIHGGWRWRPRPRALIYAGRHLMKDWSVVDRLGEIRVPTLVMAGRYDFVFPPECQAELAERIPGAQLRLIGRSGHNPQDEQPSEVMAALRAFIVPTPPLAVRARPESSARNRETDAVPVLA
jgi:pimeloyl-ACP methyl ester carboxylesterase